MKKFIFFLMALCLWTGMSAQTGISHAMRSMLRETPSQQPLHAWITLDGQSASVLEENGVHVDSRYGNIVAVTASGADLQRVAARRGVKSITAPSRLHLHCDSSRSVTHVNPILAGEGIPVPLDGNGVVVGIVDCGIEYGHIAFKDANGKSRISRVYHPADKGGTVLMGGETMPGREYTTPEQIAAVGTDDRSMSHGCHTTGIAAGSLVGGYGGMAPGAEIVITGIPNTELTDINVALGARYIAAYAASVGKPCVINMSLGNHDGPHDGTGMLARVIDELNRQYGTIFVLSAGNEAGKGVYMNKKFTAGDTSLRSVLATAGSNQSEVDIWSRTDDPLSLTYSLCDNTSHSILCSTQPLTADTVLTLGNDPAFSGLASGSITVTQGFDPINGKYHINVKHKANTGSNCLVISVNGYAGQEVDVWDVNGDASFSDYGFAGYTDGIDTFSISDMATGESSISVGACAGRTTYPTGGRTVSTGYSMGAMARFSSYGTDLTGKKHPFVVAPGVSVVSSVSNYNCNKSSYSQRVANGSQYDYWYVKSGTSMAAPCVTGIVALWLQACPSLTAQQIKKVMAQTAVRPSNATVQYGPNGEIDALAGLRKILSEYCTPTGDVNADGVVDVVDMNIIANIVLGIDHAENYGRRAHVTGGDSVDVNDLNEIINIILNK